MAFQKYQSEQVQQIVPGFVEAYGRAGASIGQGIANVGASIAKGMEDAEKRKQEEAKIQGMLSPYLKSDQRVQSVKQQLSAGWLKKDDEGNVFIPDEHKDKFDPAKANEAIAFYNETGGDGSKLTGAALTKFATSFESEKKYAADQAAQEDKRLEKLKTLAEIRKMEADAYATASKAGRAEIIGAFGAGTDMSTFTPSISTQPARSVLDGTPYANGGGAVSTGVPASAPASGSILSNTAPSGVFTTDLSGKGFSLTPEAAPAGFNLQRYASGKPLVAKISEAGTSPTQTTEEPSAALTAGTSPATTGATPASLPGSMTTAINPGVTTTSTSTNYLEQIPIVQQARIDLDKAWQTEISTFSANYNLAVSRLTASGATAEELKALGESFNSQYKLKADRYTANVATISDRLAMFQKAADEARAAQTSGIATLTAEQAKDKANMTKVEFEAKYGKPVEPGKEAPASDKKGTFAATVQSRVQNAGIIPGRTGGTEQTNLRRAAQEEHTKIMREYPTWYNVGLTTKGGDEYQMQLLSYPTSAPIDATIKAKVDENVVGYTEGRAFLTQLLDAVNGTDEERAKNYLNRFLATTSKDEEFATGQMLGQFGVAAFRRAIVSGGNFSDADREYVQKIITQINTPNPFATKDYLKAQTKKLAEFIDYKFRSGLSAQGVRLDLDTAKKFLTREKDDVGLAELAKTEDFYRAYKIDTKSTKAVSRGNESIDPVAIRNRAKAARDAGNTLLAAELERILKSDQDAKDAAVKKAKEAAAKARGA